MQGRQFTRRREKESNKVIDGCEVTLFNVHKLRIIAYKSLIGGEVTYSMKFVIMFTRSVNYIVWIQNSKLLMN